MIVPDTNVIIYYEGHIPTPDDHQKQTLARDLLDAIGPERLAIPVQVLGETFRVLTRKARLSAADAAEVVASWRAAASVLPSTPTALDQALHLARDHGVPVWDALILAVAAEHDCTLLLSEDFQDGFIWRGTTVVNPFASSRHPLLSQLLPDGTSP